MSIIHPKRHTRPRPRTIRLPETTHHRLRRAYPAAIQFLRQPTAAGGFGTAAGTTRECTCGVCVQLEVGRVSVWKVSE